MAKPFRKLAGSVRKKVDALAVENEETKDSGSYEDDEEEYEDDEDIEKK